MTIRRRNLLSGGLALAGIASTPAWARTGEVRSLSLLNLHTGERLAAAYWEAGGYIPDAMQALARVLRDHRTGDVHPMEPGLFDLVATLRTRLQTDATVHVISGYRSPRTNEALRQSSSGVAKRSLHMDGMALDLRLPGVDLARVRDAAWDLQRGGVGYYPGSDFVHVDVGRVRRWSG
ncbi:DUF882 domain-containing protein [Phenylobacterium sp.]|uniref:DUF882 domain-containing protein n=1 Tax=Phenylobacterium sp. TaxID=1871053 RepID=UPI0019CD9F53|nr:DUF882 domain-containing protein [Phenylobacterium sp.]MBC7166555.1 DUF882 domain-containing protein [Phenylobacterium sp.]